jgi:hypothetical protein
MAFMKPENETPGLDGINVLKDETQKGDDTVQLPYSGLIQEIRDRYDTAKINRITDEQRWTAALRNFRGIYDSTTQFRDTEKSRAFVKITKTKVLAAYGQLLEVLFSANKFPLSIQATEQPEGVAEAVHTPLPGEQPDDSAMPMDIYGHPGDGQDLPPGATHSDLLNGFSDKMGNVPFVQGPSPDKAKSIEFRPAEESAKAMEKVVHDQLGEANAETILRHALFEMALLGTGVVKGPFTLKKTYNKWVPGPGGMQFMADEKLVPTVEAVSIWNFYPDPDAINMSGAEWVVERHSFSRTQMRQLMKRPHFRAEAIRQALEIGPNWMPEWFETVIKDNQATTEPQRFEVLEYWGVMDTDLALEAGIELPESWTELDEVQINAWICGDMILRLVLNPFTPARIPYQACPYEIHPYQFFGIGIPENMDDCQMIMNGAARMAIDNLVLAGSLIFDIDETALVPGQEMKIYPGKVFRRQAGTAGQAVYGIKFPSTAQENLTLFDKFRQLADEATGIQSYSHGTTGIQSTTRTAAGMSMLMGAAALNVKTVVKNIDDFLIRPLGEALFAWNMQFNKDVPEIRGDLEVKARGTSSLLQKEVKSQRLLTFLQLSGNPAIAPFIKLHTLVKEIAESLDIDPEKIINDPEQAALQAMIIGTAGGLNPQGGQASPPDPTGAGGQNIGVGTAPQPGEPAHSANKQDNSTSANVTPNQ